jgi:hypothetical protein
MRSISIKSFTRYLADHEKVIMKFLCNNYTTNLILSAFKIYFKDTEIKASVDKLTNGT